MLRSLRKLLSLLAAASLAIAMLSAATSACVAMTAASVESGHAAGDAHDCGETPPAAPARHDCRMLASCANVALSTQLGLATGGSIPAVRPVALNDARPSDVIPALVAPPPRA